MWLAIEQLKKGPSRVVLANLRPPTEQTSFGFWRVSELFPVDKSAFKLPKSNAYHVAFFVHPSAFCAIGGLESVDKAQLLFCAGLASIVYCGEDQSQIATLLEKWKDKLTAYEIWEVVDGVIKKDDVRLEKPAESQALTLVLANHKIQNPDLCWIIWELMLNVDRFVNLSAQYSPSNLEKCKKWVSSINEIIHELDYLDALDRNESATAPATISPTYAQKLRQEPFARKQRSNSNMDRLVHVNSALIYSTSQAFYGGVPSAMSFPLTSPHSLLGIGTAWFALRNLCAFIEKAFGKYSVARVVSDQFPKLAWKDHLGIGYETPRLDFQKDCLDKAASDEVRPKITYFSSRLGFGESDFTVTCAMQTLHAAGSPRYTLMTISHEMLHAHVRSLILSVFLEKDDSGEELSFQESLNRCIEQFLTFLRTKSTIDLHLIQTVRFVLIHFILEYRKYSDVASGLREQGENGEPALPTFDVTIPATSPIWEKAFRSAHRFMEEIFVHTLDFHYFYEASTDTYIDSLWTSWEYVPSVSEKLEWYILRTLVAIGTTVKGKEAVDRFDEAKKLLEARLVELNQQNSNSGVIAEVLRHLSSEKSTRWLLLLFIPSIAVADMVAKFLLDARISQELRREDAWTVQTDEGDRITHTLKESSFEEEAVGNPIVFIYERLAKALLARAEGPFPKDESEITVWMFLAMADYATENRANVGQEEVK